jgi:hypothetical protein
VFLPLQSEQSPTGVIGDTSGSVIFGVCTQAQPAGFGADSVFSYAFRFDPIRPAGVRLAPRVGDKFILRTTKPFRRGDKFTFTSRATAVDNDIAKSQLDRIRVVPNPYIASSVYEQPLPPGVTQGRGERLIYFTHIPKNSTIRIYTQRGRLVQTLLHSGGDDGSVPWNLRSGENQEVAYGLYFYHIDAPNVGVATGKFVLIK